MDSKYSIVSVELMHMTKGARRVLKDTVGVFRDAAAEILEAACDHWDQIRNLGSMEAMAYVEHLVHSTKSHPDAEYQFDEHFFKFPSYMRRAAINSVVGYIHSHETRCDQYYSKRDGIVSRGKHYKVMEPAFCFHPNLCPVLYDKSSFTMEGMSVQIKVRVRNTWDWMEFRVSHQDMRCLLKAVFAGAKICQPQLVYKYHKYYLSFPVKHRYAKFPDIPLDQRAVLSVDRGLNHGAVCSVVSASGTVHGRYFDPFKEDMDRITHIICLIRKKASESGTGQSLASLYTKLRGLKENYVRQLSRWIVDIAIKHRVYGIVLEQLGRIKGRGGMKARLHHWASSKIRDYIRGMGFRAGIRTFLVNPKGTSMYAYDGSGKVVRDSDNFSLCTFTTGKRYNCDLSASYNIASRYFLREYKKSITPDVWSESAAKVPGLSKGTTWTLSTLRRFREVLSTS